MSCRRWERLIEWAARNENKQKELEFKEKLVECIVYSIQERIARRRLKDVDALIDYGRALARKYGIEELDFHIDRLTKEVEEVRRRRAVSR